MVKKSTVRNKKIAIFIILIALICGISLSVMLINEYIPEPLKQVSSHDEKVNLIKKIQKDFSIALYYPKLENTIGETVALEAEKIFTNIIDMKEELIKDDASVMLLIDYKLKEISDSIIQIRFEIVDKNNPEGYYPSQTILLDKNTGNRIDTTQSFDDIALRLMRQNLRNMCKENADTKELGFSRVFLEKTADDINIFSNFYIEGNELVFIIDEFEQPIIFRQNAEEIANHINLNLGIIQTIEDPVVYIPNRYIDPSRPMVAITFDDGPHLENTPQILEVLRRYDSAATFFVVGNRIGEKGSQVVLNEIESGSQVGSHSYSHPNMARMKNLDEQFYLTPTKVYEDVSKWCYQISLFRPPYGAVSKRMANESPFPFIMWNIDTMDWKTRDVQSTVNEIMNKAKDGDIILMHDIHVESKDAFIEVVPKLIDSGFQLVTVSEMMNAKGITMENGKKYFSAN